MMAFTSLGSWAVQITRDLEKHPVKKSQGVKLKNQKHKHCYAGKRYVKYKKNGLISVWAVGAPHVPDEIFKIK